MGDFMVFTGLLALGASLLGSIMASFAAPVNVIAGKNNGEEVVLSRMNEDTRSRMYKIGVATAIGGIFYFTVDLVVAVYYCPHFFR